ncbi:Tri7 [Nannizzia gypsea CBS 118893]|uniref:Tri7 n=1 Tax=Arthroderma gypseum (strain ATCC MYA-4604 / CBS 118893) TaxID=535722 RepID=E4V5V7_ARTGP|nr:Tri7 [Nannizzia gypsea CBS 118893]EFR05482.1 Tri7 [Nannizzia gypsea CBS 118893]
MTYSYSHGYALATFVAAITAHILLVLVLVYVPPTSSLRAWLLPVLVVPTLVVSRTAVHATPVMPLNFVIGVGYGLRLALEMFDLLCISKVAYPGHTGSKTSDGTRGKPGDSLPWYTRAYRAAVWLGEASSTDRGRNGYIDISREKAKKTSKRQFLVFRSIRFILCYLLLDLITSQSLEDADVKFAPGKEKILSRIIAGDFSGQDFGETLGSIVGFAAAGYLNLVVLIDFASVLAVSLGISEVQDWPPWFGPLTKLYSIRNFWSVVWHRQLRVLLYNHGYFITHSILRLPLPDSVSPESKALLLLIRYVRMQAIFLMSGLMHMPIDMMQNIPLRESGIVMFFTAQALGILIEDTVCSTYRWITTGSFSRQAHRGSRTKEPALWKKLIGFAWVLCWAMCCVPPWIFPTIRQSAMSAVPYSFFTKA